MVTNIMALWLNGCHVKPSKISILSVYKVSITCIRGSIKIFISIPGCLGLYIRMDSKRYFLFWHNHRQYHWPPRDMGASLFTKRIHSIRTQCKPNITQVLSNFQIIVLIKLLPLAINSGWLISARLFWGFEFTVVACARKLVDWLTIILEHGLYTLASMCTW